jgi:hypothetical protein
VKNMLLRVNCWRWLLPVLAVLLSHAAMGQGTIVYVHAPLSNPNGDPNHLPWDSLGTQVGPDFPIVINGQTVLTFSAPLVAGQPSSFVVQPSSMSAVIGQQPFVDFPDNIWLVPLPTGTVIGPAAAGYNWFASSSLITSARDTVTSGYFTDLESAYLGFQFQQNSETYYGWARIGCPVSGLNAGWIYDYAYVTTPNTPIMAGAVPEPSTTMLIILAVSVMSLKRKQWR